MNCSRGAGGTQTRSSIHKKNTITTKKPTNQQVRRTKVPLYREKRRFLAAMVRAVSVSQRTGLVSPPSFAKLAPPNFWCLPRPAASQEGHRQSNSETLLIKLLPNPVTRKAQPWHVSSLLAGRGEALARRDLAGERLRLPADKQLRVESREAAALPCPGGETGEAGIPIAPPRAEKGTGSLPRPAPPTPRPFCCFCCCIPPRPLPLDTTSSFTMSIISSGMRRYLIVLPRM